MEEKDITALKNSKMYIVKIGKWMNLFSIFSVLGILFVVACGMALLYYSGTLPEDQPHYIDNLVGLGGIALFVVAAAIVPAVVNMRHIVHAAKAIKVNNDFAPLRSFMRYNRKLWHYLAVLMIVMLSAAVVASVLLYIYFLPTLSTI